MQEQKISAHRKIHNAGYSREALTCFFCLPLLIDFPIECLWLPRWLFDEKWMRKVIEGCKLLSGMQFSCVPETELAQAVRWGGGDAILFFIETRNCFIIDSPHFFLSLKEHQRGMKPSACCCVDALLQCWLLMAFFSQKRREMLYMCVCTFFPWWRFYAMGKNFLSSRYFQKSSLFLSRSLYLSIHFQNCSSSPILYLTTVILHFLQDAK